MSKVATIAEPLNRTDAAQVASRAAGAVCPNCKTPCGALNLLTSMTRYYVCRTCAARWQVARNWQAVEDGMV